MKRIGYSSLIALVLVLSRFIWFQLRYAQFYYDIWGTLLLGAIIFISAVLFLRKRQ